MAHTEGRIRVLVVDDHPILREGVAAMLEGHAEIVLIGEACDGAEALDKFRALSPDVVLMDLQMPGTNGFEAIAAIREESPSARIVVFTTYGTDGQASRALRAGAQGYLLKSSLRTEMFDAIRAVHAGRRHVHPDIDGLLSARSTDSLLSERELSILQLVSQGKANREIAAELSVSQETIKANLKSIFAKLEVSDRTQAVTTALQRGLIEL
jgi:DNA-binding NarL/FixJ family response regulator